MPLLPPASIARRSFVPLLLIGLLDRLFLLLLFGFKYVGDDDCIIWSAAIDYAHGRFHEPYFYGQDYAVMLEALVAAPFTWPGIPLNILMPVVTSALALAPYWSFAFWHRKHGRPVAALVFLAMPVLLSVEFGLMTTITRCFISGIAPLAFVPWILDMRRHDPKSFLVGLTISAAAFINPNALVLGVALGAWHLFTSPQRIRTVLLMLAGTVPFVIAFLAAQAYCRAHPERIVHTLHDWRMWFVPFGPVLESFGMLDAHFRWLFPILPSVGSLTFLALVGLIGWHLWKRDFRQSLTLISVLVLIVLSFAFPKTHDGLNSVWFPYSRMYLAMPLVLCWGISAVEVRGRWAGMIAVALVGACGLSLVLKRWQAPMIIQEQIDVPTYVVSEAPLTDLRADAERVHELGQEHHIGLVVTAKWEQPVSPHYRCYLYPLLHPSLPPTYLYDHERRYWQREAFSDSVVPDLLLLGGNRSMWTGHMRMNGRWIDVSDGRSGQLHVLHGNTEPTDSVIARLMRMQEGH